MYRICYIEQAPITRVAEALGGGDGAAVNGGQLDHTRVHTHRLHRCARPPSQVHAAGGAEPLPMGSHVRTHTCYPMYTCSRSRTPAHRFICTCVHVYTYVYIPYMRIHAAGGTEPLPMHVCITCVRVHRAGGAEAPPTAQDGQAYRRHKQAAQDGQAYRRHKQAGAYLSTASFGAREGGVTADVVIQRHHRINLRPDAVKCSRELRIAFENTAQHGAPRQQEW